MLIRQTLLYLPAQILSPLVQFVSLLVWAKLLTPADLGVVTLVIASQEIAFAAFFGWWSRYVLRFVGKVGQPETRAGFLRTEVVATALSTLGQTVVVAPVLIYEFGARMTPGLLVLATLFMMTRSLNNYMSERARAEARIALYSWIQIAGPVIGFVVGLLIIWRVGSTPAAVFGGFAVAQLLGTAVGLAMCDYGRAIGRPDRAMLRTAATFGGAVMLASFLAIVAINAPRFIVNRELGLAAVGMFAVGYGLGLRASAFACTLVTAGAYPMVVKRMEREGKAAAFEQLRRNMVLVALSAMPAAFGLLAVNRSVIQVLIAPEFREASYAVLPLATMGGLFRYVRAHTSDQVFLVCLRPGFSTMIAVVDIVVAVASAWIGLKTMGLAGAALGPMVSGAATLAISFVLSRSMFGFRAPVGGFLRALAASLAMFAAIAALPVAQHWGLLVLYVAIGGAVYAAAVTLLLPDERRALTGRLLRRKPAREAAA